MLKTYAAVADRISFLLAFVKKERIVEKTSVLDIHTSKLRPGAEGLKRAMTEMTVSKRTSVKKRTVSRARVRFDAK